MEAWLKSRRILGRHGRWLSEGRSARVTGGCGRHGAGKGPLLRSGPVGVGIWAEAGRRGSGAVAQFEITPVKAGIMSRGRALPLPY